MKLILLLALFSLGLKASAQPPYQVERDSAGNFVLVQNGQKTAFDTIQVKNNLVQKGDQLLTVENEIQLIEQLIVLRRRAAALREERNTLLDIIERTRQCAN